MNSITNGNSTHVPAFLVKLWRIVDDPATNDLIGWSEIGNSFLIHNQSKFARELLPLYYKHNNMASFVRQLNMYGFHKVISVEQGGLRLEKEEMEFAHPFFLCGQESSLELIKRKISTSKIEESRSRPENFNKVLMDVRQMKGKQETMDAKLLNMKRENEALWRELSVLRQKHVKQQQIVSKLLQFLVSMMSTQSHRIGFKRRLPLMLADSEDQKAPKLSRPTNPTSEEGSPHGPVIHDVTEEEPLIILSIPDSVEEEELEPDPSVVSNLLDTAAAAMIEEADPAPNMASSSQTKTTPGENITQFTTGQQLTAETILPDFLDTRDVVIAQGDTNDYTKKPTPPTPTVADLLGFQFSVPEPEQQQQNTQPQKGIPSSDMVRVNDFVTRDVLDDHLGDVTNGLANLKDFLQGGQYNIDMDTLSGLFGHHSTDILGLGNELNSKEGNIGVSEGDLGGVGSEMIPYNPCLFELAEDDSNFFVDSPSHTFLDEELESMLTTDKSQLTEGSLKF